MVVFGQEIKASGWPWDAKVNGGARAGAYGDPEWPDGPERFRDAYRHVVTSFRKAGVRNVTWIYWTSIPFDAAGNYPVKPKPWDLDRYYYPGDRYIDWVAGGVAGYFPQGGWHKWKPFTPLVDALYRQLTDFAPTKPQLLELSVVHSPKRGDMAAWIRSAYAQLASGRWPRVKAANWWDQRVQGNTTTIDVTPGVTPHVSPRGRKPSLSRAGEVPMRIVTSLAVGALSLLVAGSTAAAAAKKSPIFAYDATAPLRATATPIEGTASVRAERITFRSADGQTVPALLGIPRHGSTPFPCVIVQHGGGGSKELVREAWDGFAALGMATFGIDARNHGERGNAAAVGRALNDPRTWEATLRGTVIDLRRAIDYLERRPECNPERIGFFGGSMGAFIGALLAGADTRVQAPVLLAAGADWRLTLKLSDAIMPGIERKPARFKRALALLAPIDPKHWVGRISPRPVLMINALKDRAVPPASARALHRAARSPKRIVWVEGGHEFEGAAAMRAGQEYVAWFAKHLARAS